MRFNDPNFLADIMGMPVPHADAFLDVARSQKCVILVRATGPTCLGLLEEGYDTKGYRIHGKSCDWGPMAGFVMRDPRLNKYGGNKAQFNRQKHDEAINKDSENQGWKASTTPLYISEPRVQWLRANNYLPGITRTQNGYNGYASVLDVAFFYALIRRSDGMYSVCIDHTQKDRKFKQEAGRFFQAIHNIRDYEPLLAMTNPPGYAGVNHNSADHLKAVTGDYDLFAVWPYAESYNPSPYSDDHRPLGTVRGNLNPHERGNVQQKERDFTHSGQGTKLGNITPRIYMICQCINSRVGRQVLWHSDEAARPFVDDVDLPVIAFNPAGSYFGIETIADLKDYIKACWSESIHVTLSNAWAQDPTVNNPNRLGGEYGYFVPADGVRIIVPNWYNA